MPPDPQPPGSVRSAAVVNDDIRTLAQGAWGRPFTDEERARYQGLRDEWVAAVRQEITEAA
ncbi:hypothetical protein ABZ235_22975 [Streptomyces canus]|uniref:hypothetical protein n=1 Tax=Streptomyces canus TaxID=58343 RepID=UPI0033BD91B4